jgi:hypothetical protein
MLTHQLTASQEAAAECGWAVSVTYEDGACLRLRLAAPEAAAGGAGGAGGGARARVVASLSCADGVHVTLGTHVALLALLVQEYLLTGAKVRVYFTSAKGHMLTCA